MTAAGRPGRCPANATAWCALHERYMNEVYIHRRGCVLRMCKHLRWLDQHIPAEAVRGGTGTPPQRRDADK